MNSKDRHEARYKRRKEKRINKKKEYLKEYSFEKICSFDSLRKAFYKCRKGCNWKASVERYGRNVLRNSLKYSQMLLRGEIVTRGFVEFDQVERGKLRHIMSVHISERVCQKSLNDNALVPLTEKTLIYENGASQKGKGTEFAARGFKRDIHRYWMRYGNKGYVICGDAHDFFGSLQHDIVEKNVRRFILDERIIKMMMGYINPFPRGLGLGSQTCQIDAVGYPDPVDHKIKGSCKYYQRYMDDWIIIVREKSDAVKLLDMITKMYADIGIAMNPKKTRIIEINNKITWLQDRYYLTKTGRVIRKPSRKNITHNRQKLKKLMQKYADGEVDLDTVYSYKQSRMGYFKGKNAYFNKCEFIDLYNNLLKEAENVRTIKQI